MNNSVILSIPQNSNFYVFCAIYFRKFDLFDCVQKQSTIIKHVGGTYSSCHKYLWQKPELFYNIFSTEDRKKVFYDTYGKVFNTHKGVKEAFQKVCQNFNHISFHISFHASLMLMRKKGIIPTGYCLVDYEELSGHCQIGLQIQTLMFKKKGKFIEIDLNSVSADVLLSDYQKREYTLLDNETKKDYVISGKDIIKRLSDGSLENFAFSHRTLVREILQKK